MNEADPLVVSVEPGLQTTVRDALRPGETFSEFIEAALTLEVERRQSRRRHIERALVAADSARTSGLYATTEAVLKDLEDILERHSA